MQAKHSEHSGVNSHALEPESLKTSFSGDGVRSAEDSNMDLARPLELSVKLVINDDDLLAIVPLKQADDSELINSLISEDLALDKVISIRRDGSDFWIARLGENAVGYAIGAVHEGSYRAQGIYVVPKYRQRGIGLALEQAQIEFARAQGCDEIFSNVMLKTIVNFI